jgi:hypothetical protein
MSKNEIKSVEIALETRKSIIYNFVLVVPFLLLFLYFGGAFGRVITSTPMTMGFFL